VRCVGVLLSLEDEHGLSVPDGVHDLGQSVENAFPTFKTPLPLAVLKALLFELFWLEAHGAVQGLTGRVGVLVVGYDLFVSVCFAGVGFVVSLAALTVAAQDVGVGTGVLVLLQLSRELLPRAVGEDAIAREKPKATGPVAAGLIGVAIANGTRIF
jgi:hypothetical protein